MAKTVYTKEEMRHALENDEKIIIAKGELAQEIRNISRRKQDTKISRGLLTVASLLATPLSGWTTHATTATAAELKIGKVTISVMELAILVGGTAAITGIVEDCKKATINPNGSVTLEF